MRRELIVAAGPGEWRAALIEDGVAVELRVERGEGGEAGSLYLGRVVRLLPALGAALVEIGQERPGFLPQSGILPRGRRLDEGERVIVAVRREVQGGKAARLTTALTARDGPAGPVAELIASRAAALDPPARLDPPATFAAALAGALPVVERVLVDDPGAIPELRAAFTDTAIAQEPESRWPVDLDQLCDEALSPTIALAGGGSVHIDPVRAAVLIDVDSGTPETGSASRTALAANLAAAPVIARQLRLRSLSGAIVIDFVGLDDRAERERVRAALARALAADPARPQLLGWTRLGHLELVRPRRLRPVAEALLEIAPGRGPAKTALTIAFEALRALRRAQRAQPGRRLGLVVAADVAATLAGDAAPAMRALEGRLGQGIAVVADPSFARTRFEIVPL